jgi:hypothetical protein
MSGKTCKYLQGEPVKRSFDTIESGQAKSSEEAFLIELVYLLIGVLKPIAFDDYFPLTTVSIFQ